MFIINDSFVYANRLFNILGENAKILIVGFSRNGKDALLEMAKNPPDLVVLDIQLPDMDGMEVMRKIKEQHKKTTVIIITNISESTIREKCKELGAEGFYDRATEFELAVKKINSLINGKFN